MRERFEKSIHNNGDVQLLVDQLIRESGVKPEDYVTVYVTRDGNLVYPGEVGAPAFDNMVTHAPPANEHLFILNSEFERLKNDIGGTWNKKVLPS
jgi:hypothetical protein